MTEVWKQCEDQAVNGEFRLRRYLGASGPSAVFLAERGEQNPQRVAIKLLPADSKGAQRQIARWKQAAQLAHPHLLPIYQQGRCRLGGAELLYVVMEYAEENLAQILPERPLAPAEVREMLPPVLEALAFLHGKGFVHGRLKPANILAIGDQVKLSSDALCPVGETRDDLRKPGVYDPPETLGGRASTAGDVWSLAITLVEALTQHLPVCQATPAGLPAPSGSEPALPATIPEPFLEIARQCLLRDPKRRCTVAEIAARLRLAPSPVPNVRDIGASSSGQVSPAREKQPPQKGSPIERASARPQKAPAPRPDSIVPILSGQGASRSGPAKRGRLVPIGVAAGLALAAILAVPKLLHRRPESRPAPLESGPSRAQTASSAVLEGPKAQPKPQPSVPAKPEHKPSVRETQELTQEPGDTAQDLSASLPPPALPRSAPQTKTPATTLAGGGLQGEVLEQVLPEVSRKARDTIQGTIRVSVRVRVDPSGEVTHAELDSPGPSKYFAAQALRAARLWKFVSPLVDGRDVSSEWILRFLFTSTGTKAAAVRAAP